MKHFGLLALILGIVITSLGSLQADENDVVKVLCYNIRLDNSGDGEDNWQKRKDFAMSVMTDEDYDFIGLQEVVVEKRGGDVGQLEDVVKNLPDYGVIYRSRELSEEHGECTPVFYNKKRWELDPKEHGSFWLSATPGVPGSNTWNGACIRIASWGRFTCKKTGKSLYFANTHFDHVSDPARENSAALLVDLIGKRKHKDEPVILTGDFNSSEKSNPIQYLSGNKALIDGKEMEPPLKLIDTYRVYKPDGKEEGTFHGFTGKPGKHKIDFIFATPGTKVLNSNIIRIEREGRYPSDHFPINAKLFW